MLCNLMGSVLKLLVETRTKGLTKLLTFVGISKETAASGFRANLAAYKTHDVQNLSNRGTNSKNGIVKI